MEILVAIVETPVAAVLFDLDGTLVDSRDYWFAVVVDASRHFGGRKVSRVEFDASFGQSSRADAAQFFPSASVEQVDAFYSAALPRHGQHLRLAPGAQEVVHQARFRGMRVACVTNSPRRFAEDVLREVGLRAGMDALACADEVPLPKPAPDVVHLALQRLGVAAAAGVMVGDSRFDVMAARAAGCRVVGLGVAGDVSFERLLDVGAWLWP